MRGRYIPDVIDYNFYYRVSLSFSFAIRSSSRQ
jgi:hypothetical protein